MKPEEASAIKCDRCGAMVGLYRHSNGWRCPLCIWSERENLIEQAKDLLNATDYTNIGKRISYNNNNNNPTHVVVVSRLSMDGLAKVVQEVTS